MAVCIKNIIDNAINTNIKYFGFVKYISTYKVTIFFYFLESASVDIELEFCGDV